MFNQAKKAVLEFCQKYKHGLVLLYLLLYLPWFAYLEKHVTSNFNVIHMAVDDYIPFVEFFVVPYFLWFGYVAYAVLYFLFKNKTEFYKLCTFLFTGMTVFLIVSTVYPNGQYLRPYTFVHNNICVDLVKWLYATDTPTNLFPSIHVYNSIAVHFAIINSESLRNNKRVRVSSFILMTSIIMSTMFLKQHSVFDVITAFVMAAVMYSFVYGKSLQFSRQKAYENQFHQI